MLPEGDLGVSGQRVGRPRRAATEEFEEVSFEDDDTIRARIIGSPNRLAVARAATEACAEHHGIDFDRARAELRLLVSTALQNRSWRRNQGGFWIIDFKGMEVVLPPPGQVILSYRTRHYERLPSEVISGAPSRFGGRGSTQPYGDPLPFEEIMERLTSPSFSDRLVASWTRRFGDEMELSRIFEHDLAVGTWSHDPERSRWILRAGPKCWAIREDNAVVVATWPVATAEPPLPEA